MSQDQENADGEVAGEPMGTPQSAGDLPQPAQRAKDTYVSRFAAAGDTPLVAAWAPGRINFIGEHVDYSEGLVLPAAVDRIVALVGQRTDESRAELYSALAHETASFATDPGALQGEMPADLPRWARYIRGVLAELAALPQSRSPSVPGFHAVLAGNVPIGGGMSSSAALCVATATFAAALGAPQLSPVETARLCQRAEEHATGTHIGIMDQMASCLGRAGNALLLDCRTLAYQYIPAQLGAVTLVVFDSGVPHTLSESGYNTRRGEMEQAVAGIAPLIQAQEGAREIRTARDVTTRDLEDFGSTLPDVLFRRLRHAVTENQRVQEAATVLRSGDLVQLGQLMIASHASLRDDYEVSCEELDAAVEIALTVPGIVGARLMGAGFGGSALMLVEQEALDRLARVLATQYPTYSKASGTMHVCQIANGPQAREVTA